MRRTPRFAELVKECHAQGKVVAAICHGPVRTCAAVQGLTCFGRVARLSCLDFVQWLLVSAKVLKGKRATSYFSIRDDIENAGKQPTDVSVAAPITPLLLGAR